MTLNDPEQKQRTDLWGHRGSRPNNNISELPCLTGSY